MFRGAGYAAYQGVSVVDDMIVIKFLLLFGFTGLAALRTQVHSLEDRGCCSSGRTSLVSISVNMSLCTCHPAVMIGCGNRCLLASMSL